MLIYQVIIMYHITVYSDKNHINMNNSDTKDGTGLILA